MSLFKKKPQTQNLEALRDITDDVIEADFVPYACHWDPYTIVTKNGELLQTIKITGFIHEQLAHDEDDTDLRSKIRDAVLQYIDSTQYAVWVHTIRRKKSLQAGGAFKRDFAGYLDRFWNDRNDWEHQFTNEVYVTVVHEGQSAKLFDPAGFARGILPRIDQKYRERYLDETCEKLGAVMERMLPILESYGAVRLGVVQRDGIYYSELCAFLGKLTTMLDLDFPVSDVDIAHALTDYDVTFGFNAMEVRMRADGRRRFGSMLTMREYRELPTALLDRLLQIPAEFIISQCFDFIHAKGALKGFQYQKELFDISDASMLAEKTGLTNILSSNKGNAVDFGLHQLSVFLLADSVKAMEAGVTKAVAALGALGMIPMREDIKFEECYWAQLPANFEFIKRLKPINTARIAGFANLSNFPAGQKEGNHWGAAVTTFHTAAHTPYFFNFHDKDNGHTTIIGPYGAGKTVLMNFLLAQARKFDNRLFFFDRGRGSEIFVRSLGGAYCNPAPGADNRAYAQIRLNPLQLEDTPRNREFLSDWLTCLAGDSENKDLRAACEKAIASVMQLSKTERGLSKCLDIINAENTALAALFAPWTGQGEAAALFNHAEDTLTLDEKIYGFEMDSLVAHKAALAPVFIYLMHRIMLALDGSPTIIVLDEAWTLLSIPYFSVRLKAWLETLRARNAMVVFATEHVEEVTGSSLNGTLMEHIATQIYLPDDDADASYAEAFGLTEKEVAYLTVMNTEDRHFLLKRGADTIVAELNLSGMADIIAVLSATDAHLNIMEEAIAAGGESTAQWMPKFLEAI